MYTKESKIGVIGSGIVGQVLAKAFITEGNQVMLGTRNPAKQDLLTFHQDNAEVQIATFAQAAQFGDIIVLAVNGNAAIEVIYLAGIRNLEGKVVIDTSNPIAPKPPINGVLSFFTNLDESLMEQLQQLAPDTCFVKAFNSVGNAVMYKPSFSVPPTMFICGNSESAKTTVTQILSAFGWETADMGAAEAARAIEPLCMLWCIPGFRENSWGHAFKLLK